MRPNKVLLLLGIIAGTVGITNASQIVLDPGLLPSSQGWDYSATGLHAGAVETDIYTTDGSVLNMNTMDQPYDGSGYAMYRHYDGVSSSMPATLEWTSRTIEYEHASHPHQYFGFGVGFTAGSLRYGAGISSNQVALYNGGGFKYLAVDATEVHTYRIETDGTPSYDFYVDDVLTASASARYVAEPNNILFGDFTGTANANVDITALEFRQIPEPATMGLIGLVTGGIYFARRFFVV